MSSSPSSDFFSSPSADSTSYLLPGRMAESLKAADVVEEKSAKVLGKRKRRAGPEVQQLQALEEMQEAFTAMRSATLRMMQSLTKTRLYNRAIREKFSDRTARQQRRHLRRIAKQKAAAAAASEDYKVPAAFYEIKPELASLLGLPANTYVRRQDVSSLIASYIRAQTQPGKPFQVSEPLRQVIGDEWSARISAGEKPFTSFTFNLIAKERGLYVRRAPEPSKQQAAEIFSALGYDLDREED